MLIGKMSKKTSKELWNDMKHQSDRILSGLDPSHWPEWISFNKLKYIRYTLTTILFCIILLLDTSIWIKLLVLTIYFLNIFVTMILSVGVGVLAERTRTITEKDEGSQEFLAQLMKITDNYPKA